MQIDMVEIGKKIVRDVSVGIAKVPVEERSRIIKGTEHPTRYVDKVAEDIIFRGLERASSEYGISFHTMSEEKMTEDGEYVFEEIGVPRNGTVYVLGDPIDGSGNAIADMPLYTCNLCFTSPENNYLVLQLGNFKFAVVGELERQRIYYAEKGAGRAFVEDSNGVSRQLSTSPEIDPQKTMVIVDQYTAKDRQECDRRFRNLRLGFRDFGRPRSAGYELMALVRPAGIIPAYAGYAAMNQTVENFLPGKIIVEEAGGISSDFDGQNSDVYELKSRTRPHILVAANKDILRNMRAFVNPE